MVTAGIFPFKQNSHGRAGNRTRDLMISSQRLWPLDHEAGLCGERNVIYLSLHTEGLLFCCCVCLQVVKNRSGRQQHTVGTATGHHCQKTFLLCCKLLSSLPLLWPQMNTVWSSAYMCSTSTMIKMLATQHTCTWSNPSTSPPCLKLYEIIRHNYQSFIYSTTDAQVSCLKKTIPKFTLKQLRHVSVLQLHHHQGAH
jgi:hypothetical protein